MASVSEWLQEWANGASIHFLNPACTKNLLCLLVQSHKLHLAGFGSGKVINPLSRPTSAHRSLNRSPRRMPVNIASRAHDPYTGSSLGSNRSSFSVQKACLAILHLNQSHPTKGITVGRPFVGHTVLRVGRAGHHQSWLLHVGLP